MTLSALTITSFPSTVLVVEDEPVILRVLQKLLTARGMHVVTAATGEEALVQIKSQGLGCVLTDKNLPGIDGLEVMRQAKQIQPHCAWIIMTGYASTQSAVEGMRLGATDYLEKPFADLDLVAQKIENAIRSQRSYFERDLLLERVRSFSAELQDRNQDIDRQRTEIEMFNRILEARVKQATADQTQQIWELRDSLAKGRDMDFAITVHAEGILEFARSISLSDAPEEIAIARGALARIARQLEAHVGLLKRAEAETANPHSPQ